MSYDSMGIFLVYMLRIFSFYCGFVIKSNGILYNSNIDYYLIIVYNVVY